MRIEDVGSLVELLVKLVKLQRLMKVATMEQRERILAGAKGVVDQLVSEFDGDETWCYALLTFGGQYYGQDTKYWIGDGMKEETVADALRREVLHQHRLEDFIEGSPELDVATIFLDED